MTTRPYRLIETRAATLGGTEILQRGNFATAAAALSRVVAIETRNPELAMRMHVSGPNGQRLSWSCERELRELANKHAH